MRAPSTDQDALPATAKGNDGEQIRNGATYHSDHELAIVKAELADGVEHNNTKYFGNSNPNAGNSSYDEDTMVPEDATQAVLKDDSTTASNDPQQLSKYGYAGLKSASKRKRSSDIGKLKKICFTVLDIICPLFKKGKYN